MTSTRTLRYYEELGLIQSRRQEGYAYRMYDEGTMIRGFNNPCPTKVGEPYRYEFWVTIPEEMSVPMSLKKKYFEGGLYAAHCIKMGNFEEWKLITEWVESSNEYIH